MVVVGIVSEVGVNVEYIFYEGVVLVMMVVVNGEVDCIVVGVVEVVL